MRRPIRWSSSASWWSIWKGAWSRCEASRSPLTPTEFELLRLFVRNEGKLLTHPAILREVWGPAYGTESNYLHVYVSQLRQKIERTRPARASC